MNDHQRAQAKALVDALMGSRCGDAYSPQRAAAAIAERIGVVLTPRQVWNLWIDGDEG